MTNKELIQEARLSGGIASRELADALEAALKERDDAWREARNAGAPMGISAVHGASLATLICGIGDCAVRRYDEIYDELDVAKAERESLRAVIHRVMEASGVKLANPSGDLAEDFANVMQAWALAAENQRADLVASLNESGGLLQKFQEERDAAKAKTERLKNAIKLVRPILRSHIVQDGMTIAQLEAECERLREVLGKSEHQLQRWRSLGADTPSGMECVLDMALTAHREDKAAILSLKERVSKLGEALAWMEVVLDPMMPTDPQSIGWKLEFNVPMQTEFRKAFAALRPTGEEPNV